MLTIPSQVPFAGKIKSGEVVKIECVDWTGGQIGNNDSADDMKNSMYSQTNPLPSVCRNQS